LIDDGLRDANPSYDPYLGLAEKVKKQEEGINL
jgi:hypothetical protein